MLRQFLIIFIMLCVVLISTVYSEDKFVGKGKRGAADKGERDVIKDIVGKAVGRNKLIRSDKVEPSHIEGWKQRRIWVKSPYGERPYLIYMLEDKNLFILGSVFDSKGNNLTETSVGKIRPKVVRKEEMNLIDNYRIGPKDAEVRAVLWIGLDLRSKFLFESVRNKIYLPNKDKMNIHIKFFPRGEKDYNKMKALTCFKGEAFESALGTMMNALTAWGSPDEIKAFKEKRGVTNDSLCDEFVIQEDLELAMKLNFPALPVMFINGKMYLEKITTEDISKLSGVPLK